MRPKLLALLTVSALSLVGCSAAETTSGQPATASQSAVESAKAKAEHVYEDGSYDIYDAQTGKTIRMDKNGFEVRKPELVKVEDIESEFISLVETRAPAHAVTEIPSDKVLVKSFHEYCEDGSPMDFSSVEPLNDNVEKLSEDWLCGELDFVGKPVKELEKSRRG